MPDDGHFEEPNHSHKTRLNFTAQQRQLLMQFFFQHRDHPYADHTELEILERETQLTRKQIQVFMTNARMRKVSGFRQRVRQKRADGTRGSQDSTEQEPA
jgi:hypothetical protein